MVKNQQMEQVLYNNSVQAASPVCLTLTIIYWILLDYSACQDCFRESRQKRGFSAAMDWPYGCNQRAVARSGNTVRPYNQPGQ